MNEFRPFRVWALAGELQGSGAPDRLNQESQGRNRVVTDLRNPQLKCPDAIKLNETQLLLSLCNHDL